MRNYTGNKGIYGVYHKIINNIPPHKTMFELFAGRHAITSKLIEKTGNSVRYNLVELSLAVVDSYDFTSGTADIVVHNCNALDFIIDIPEHVDNFIFMDPPYLHNTRFSKSLYECELSDSDHMQLLSSILKCKNKIMIIHPACKLYDTMLKDWRYQIVKIRYNKKTSIEKIYMNYPKPALLQSFALLGENRTDRQRIKRKVARHLKTISALPEQERNLIIQELYKLYPAK